MCKCRSPGGQGEGWQAGGTRITSRPTQYIHPQLNQVKPILSNQKEEWNTYRKRIPHRGYDGEFFLYSWPTTCIYIYTTTVDAGIIIDAVINVIIIILMLLLHWQLMIRNAINATTTAFNVTDTLKKDNSRTQWHYDSTNQQVHIYTYIYRWLYTCIYMGAHE